MVEDGRASIENAGEFALEQHSQGTGFLLAGLVDITAATEAIAAANEAHALSIDPHAVDSMLKKLTGMQDSLEAAATGASLIGSSAPLGGGYAEEVSRLNREVGREVLGHIIPKLSQAIEDLKAEIDRSRASYRNVDAAHADTMNNI